MTNARDVERRETAFVELARAKTDERRRRYRETTPGERVEGALRLSELAAELSSGVRTRGG